MDLAVQFDVEAKAHEDTLIVGFNYFADLNSPATVTLPASPAVGDVVYVKARNFTGGGKITINKGADTHRIDGQETRELENPFASVSLVYVAANDWRIF
jgi:hypothetical protein